MKIGFMSDLHLERGTEEFAAQLFAATDTLECDVLVLAGDIDEGINTLSVLHLFNQIGVPVLWVLGNHEHYNNTFCGHTERLKQAIAEAELSNVILLDKNTCDINGVVFIGATLWTDFDQAHTQCNRHAVRNLMQFAWLVSDYKKISYESGVRLTPDRVAEWHLQDLAFIENALACNADKKCVVITHHSPSNQQRRKNAAQNEWAKVADGFDYGGIYSASLDGLIQQYNPSLWIHGHIHTSLDYYVSGSSTRVVCNPRGYAPSQLNPLFSLNQVVEI